MLRHTLLSVFCLLGATCAFADIHLWEGNAANCTISDVDNTIQINYPGTYGIRAWNPNTYALQALGDITIGPSVLGNVTIRIAYSDAGGPGATNIKQGYIVNSIWYYYVYLGQL